MANLQSTWLDSESPRIRVRPLGASLCLFLELTVKKRRTQVVSSIVWGPDSIKGEVNIRISVSLLPGPPRQNASPLPPRWCVEITSHNKTLLCSTRPSQTPLSQWQEVTVLKYFWQKWKAESNHPSRTRQARWLRGQTQLPRNLTTWLQSLQAMGRRPNSKCCPLTSPHARVRAHTNKYNVKTKPERTPCSHAITPPHPAVCNHCNTGQTPAEKPKWYHYRKLGSCIPNGVPFQALYGHHWVLLLTTYSTEICLLLPPLLFFSEGGWSWTYLQSPEDLTLVTCDTSLTGVWHHIHWTECWGDWPWAINHLKAPPSSP